VQEKDDDDDAHMQTVVVAYLHDSASGAKVARCVNWPEPLKYVALQRPKNLRVRITTDAEGVEVSAEVPVKGVMLEGVGGEREGLVWADNCVDVVPGEAVVVGVKGLAVGQEERVGIRYLGL
jgi:beta-mannosidase